MDFFLLYLIKKMCLNFGRNATNFFLDPIFQSLQNSLNGVKLISKEVYENHLSQFFAQKSQKFYSIGIIVLPQK